MKNATSIGTTNYNNLISRQAQGHFVSLICTCCLFFKDLFLNVMSEIFTRDLFSIICISIIKRILAVM